MNAILISVLILLWSQTVSAENVCKTTRPSSTQSLSKVEDAQYWNCTIKNPYVGPELEVFNHTQFSIERIELWGYGSWGMRVNIPPRTTSSFKIDNLEQCQKNNVKLKLYYTKYFKVAEKCVEYYSTAELEEIKQKKIQSTQMRKIQNDMDIIRDNCVISKGKNAPVSLMDEIRRVCTEISKRPTFFQKLRWGS